MKMPLLLAATVAVTLPANAALIAHYTFDTDASATVGTDATLGDAASISTESIIGSGSLSLSGAPATDGAGTNGAVSGNSFSWGASDVRTVAFWMKANSGDFGDDAATLISLGGGTDGGSRFDVAINGNNLRLEVQSGGSTSGSVVADGSWHHIAVVVPNATSTVNDVNYYIDGTLAGTFSNAQSINTGTGPLRMGDSYQDTGRDLKGFLDDVRVYDEALDATSIAALATVPIPEPSSTALLGLGGLALILRRRKLG